MHRQCWMLLRKFGVAFNGLRVPYDPYTMKSLSLLHHMYVNNNNSIQIHGVNRAWINCSADRLYLQSTIEASATCHTSSDTSPLFKEKSNVLIYYQN